MRRGLSVVILAAGESKRMKSKKPKVLHNLMGKPLVLYPVELAEKLKPERIIVVVGENHKELKEVLSGKDIMLARQEKPLGTADAVRSAYRALKDFKGSVLILYGDAPLYRLETFENLIKLHKRSKSELSLLTTRIPFPVGYGRIIRGDNGELLDIVEEKDLKPKQKEISEINAGVYCVEKGFLFDALKKVRPNNRQKEYYLTDIVKVAVKGKKKVVSVLAKDWEETIGINRRSELGLAFSILRRRINEKWMSEGVTLEDPLTIYIEPEVEIGTDTFIESGARLMGRTKIGSECRICSNARIVDSRLGDRVTIESGSIIEGSVIDEDVKIGPMAHLRPGSFVESGARIGNFVELKNTRFGKNSKASHLTYLGDAEIGRDVNIGCGTITCNYDGEKKWKTIIEDEVFVGSDTQLIAPVRVGRGAYIGSGSTITKDVPSFSLALSRAKEVHKHGWVKRRAKKRKG